MGLVNSALHIGRSAISSYQSALSIVGNNIANAADPDYTRQEAVFDPLVSGALPQGIKPGGGVALNSLQRVINEALEARLREAIGASAASTAEAQLLTGLESQFDELGGAGISARLNELFRALQDVQNLPANEALRSVAVDQAAGLADLLRTRHQAVSAVVGGINQEIAVAIEQADVLAHEIAELNVAIVESETNHQTASALRDARDARLKDLGELLDITVRHHESGAVSVFVGSEALVQLGYTRGLQTTQQVENGQPRMQVEFADGTGEVAVGSGRIAGLLRFRDQHSVAITADLERFAAALIAAFNIEHSNGHGLRGFDIVRGTSTMSSADLPLDEAAAGLPVVPRSGSFVMSVSDAASGEVLESVIIDVRLEGGAEDTTLRSLTEAINSALSGVTASVTSDFALAIQAAPGLTFSFGHDGTGQRQDSSQVLAALGINTLFSGRSAADVRLNPTLAAHPEHFAVAGSPLVGDTGNLVHLVGLQTGPLEQLEGKSLGDFYDDFMVRVSSVTAEVRERQEITTDLRSGLQAQRESVSGVNLDEEAISLMKYERAFQGAARFTSVVDQLITEMLGILG